MTRIDFYHYADDKLHYACRLAATAIARDSRLVVYSPDEAVLSRFDQLLWTFASTRFVPHCRVKDPVAGETPVLLASEGDGLPHHDVLLNLHHEWPPFFSTFERLLEIVATDDEDKRSARARYAFYKQRGYEIKVNAIAEA